MSMTDEGLRITIRGRRKPVTDLGSLRDIREACNRAISKNGLRAGELLRPSKKGSRR